MASGTSSRLCVGSGMNEFRVLLVDPRTGEQTLAGKYETEGEAALRIMQITEPVTVELWGPFSLLARIEHKGKVSNDNDGENLLAAE